MEIRVGGIVRLNSGSPDLKVLRIENDRATVEWQGGQGETQSSEFPLTCLTLQAIPEASRCDL